MNQVFQHGDHHAMHLLQNDRRRDELILYKSSMAFSAFLEHFSNCARKFNLVSIVIPSAVDSVANFIVFLCNTIFFVDSRLSLRIREKMTTSVFARDFKTPLSDSFCNFFAILLEMRKSFFHRVAC